MNYVKSYPKFTTTIDRTNRAGIMITYKTK